MTVEERLDLLEFQVGLLFDNKDIDRLFFESGITREQHRAIMNLMETYRTRIDNGESVNHGTFEQNIYDIVSEKRGDYHFCEDIAQCLFEDHRYEEVFTALYGNMQKFAGLIAE